MSLRDPIDLYTPISNIEAHLLCSLLAEAGIGAAVVEDNSTIGVWMGGLASQLHKPKIMIERVDAERARPILARYELEGVARRKANLNSDGAQMDSIPVTCEGCGTTTQFPAAKRGTVQSCPNCLEYVDVGDNDEIEGWEETAPESDVPGDS